MPNVHRPSYSGRSGLAKQTCLSDGTSIRDVVLSGKCGNHKANTGIH